MLTEEETHIPEGTKCIHCGKPAKKIMYFAKAY
jgi:hypothetical protein